MSTRKLPSEWIWVLVLGVVLTLFLWWFPGRMKRETDSYDKGPRGKSIYAALVKRFVSDTARHERSLIPPGKTPRTLVILGPVRYPKPAEWAALHRWVSKGNTLLFAARFDKPAVDLGPFGVRILPLGEQKKAKKGRRVSIPRYDADGNPVGDPAAPYGDWQLGGQAPTPDPDRKSDGDDGDDEADPADDADGADTPTSSGEGDKPDADKPSDVRTDALDDLFDEIALKRWRRAVQTPLIKGEVLWYSRAWVEQVDAGDADILVSFGLQTQALRRRIGKGQLIVVATDDVFSNRGFVRPRAGQLAWRLLETRRSGDPVRFDEFLNATGTPEGLGILFNPQFRPITLQLLLCVVLFGWWGFRRFGPPSPPPQPPRRSITEHAEALGNLYYRAGAARHTVAIYLEYFRQELQGQSGAAGHPEQVQRLAAATGRDPEEVAQLMAQAQGAALDPNLSAARAASLIRRLSALLGERHRHSRGPDAVK